MADDPQKVGRYEILSKVGQGAMGVVYKARDPLIGRTVAIKMVAASALLPEEQREEFKRRFLREAQAAGNLHHPNIVTVYDAGEECGLPFMAQEFVEGESLAQRLKARGALPLEEALGIVRQVAQGLAYAHERGVVHRDVKPDNILLDRTGRAVITDFGIARLAESDLTRTGEVLGTPTFMSPEQVQGQDLDGRSDLFSLGAVLFLMVTGQRPFKGETISTICYRVVHAPPEPAIGQLSLPPAVTELLLRLLAKSPEDRFASAEELSAALAESLDRTMALEETMPTAPDDTKPAGPAVPTPPKGAEATSAGRRRGGVLALAVGGGILAALALGVLAAWGLRRVQVQRQGKAAVAAPVVKAAPPREQGPAREEAKPHPGPAATEDTNKTGAPASTAARAPAPPARRPEPAVARLGLIAEGPVLMGQLVLQVDGRERLRRPFVGGEGPGGRGGFLILDHLEVPPGDHELRVAVGGARPGPFAAEAATTLSFAPGQELILNVRALRVPARLRLDPVRRQDLPESLAKYFGPHPLEPPPQDSPLAVLGEEGTRALEPERGEGESGRLDLVVEGPARSGVFSVLEGSELKARETFGPDSRKGGRKGSRLEVHLNLPAGTHDLEFVLEATAPPEFRARAGWHLDLPAGRHVTLKITPRRPGGLEIVEVP